MPCALVLLVPSLRVVRYPSPGRCRCSQPTDYDDDGETQAGSRLKHLLEILEVENVLVVVTRWFGGVHLGPDRFKHINQAARDALELAGVLDDHHGGGGGKKKGRK